MAESKPALSMEMIGDFNECPVCLSPILDPPVYMCARSHIFCEDCHITLKKDNQDCPVCKGDLAGNKNIFVERMLDSLPKTQCKSQGCSFKKVDPKKVESHEDLCQYRPVTCLLCKKDFPLNDLAEHLCDVHSEHKPQAKHKFGKDYSVWWSNMPSKSFDGASSTPLMHEEKGKMQQFFLNSLVHENGRFLRWISQSESKRKIEKYKYTISILCPRAYENNGKIKRLLTHSGFCPSTDVPIEFIKNNVPCMSLPEDFLRENLDKDGKYFFEWRIDVL